MKGNCSSLQAILWVSYAVNPCGVLLCTPQSLQLTSPPSGPNCEHLPCFYHDFSFSVWVVNMKVKILERSAVTRNLLIFQVFSLAYLYVIQSLSLGTSALEWRPFLDMLEVRPWVIASFILTFFSIYWGTRFSSLFFASFCLLILGESLLFLFSNFDKLILVLIFLSRYLFNVLSYFFGSSNNKRPFIAPHLTKTLLENWANTISKSRWNHRPASSDGVLTNWDTKGCFFVSVARPHPTT